MFEFFTGRLCARTELFKRPVTLLTEQALDKTQPQFLSIHAFKIAKKKKNYAIRARFMQSLLSLAIDSLFLLTIYAHSFMFRCVLLRYRYV